MTMIVCHKCKCDVSLEYGWLVCYHTVVRHEEKENYPVEWEEFMECNCPSQHAFMTYIPCTCGVQDEQES